jgi:ATP-dependent protease ClpP protease subunit
MSETSSNPLVELIQGVNSKKRELSFTEKAVCHLHEYYISGEIEEPEKYADWFNTIRHASPNDMVKIYVNSYGGDLWSAIQFMRVIKECKAQVVASVEGACMSAATIIFLMADSFEISPHSMFMFHNYSGGTMGKGGEMLDQIRHERKWSEKLLTEIYSDFLKPDEIESVLNNKDIWMTGEEVVVRLNSRRKLLGKRQRESNRKKSL